MPLRRYVPLGLLAIAAACGGLAETPTAPSLSLTASDGSFDGDPPPPPVDTEYVASVDGEPATLDGRYFANNPDRIIWFELATQSSAVVASPNARLQYNVTTGRTTGIGTLTFESGKVLDLSTVTLHFLDGYIYGTCGDVKVDAAARTCWIGPRQSAR